MSTRFITFYSYKGGVGRTMTLANVAAWLATEAHKRVLLIDFDLEAPGLSYYASQTPLAARLPAPGLVEYFTEYRTTATLPDLKRYVLSEPEDRLGGGRLMMISAGKHGTTEYAESLAALDWSSLYESGFGFELIEHLRRAIAEEFQPDIVLIDSRTGLHGIGSIATQQLADAVVVMFGLNRQNLEGARGVLANIEENPYRSETGREIETILVASPVHEEGGGAARDALRRAEKVLGRRVDVRIPFSAAAVFEERLWPLDPEDAPRALLQVYGELGSRLLRSPALPGARPESSTFDGLVAKLFEIEGYAVTSAEGPGYDLLVERDAFPSRERIAVQVASNASTAVVARRIPRLIEALERSPSLTKAVICTPKHAGGELRHEVEKDRRLAVVSLGELMQRLIPFKRYMESLAQAYERDELSRYYEPLDVAPPERLEQRTGADTFIDEWLTDGGASPHLALLGDYGTGKTSFCRRLAAKLARERLAEDDWTGRVPVLVSLRNYAKALNVESLVNDLLSDRQRFGSGSFAAFDLLNREGKLLILLDGFDEMATRADERVVLENFRELRRLVHPNSKVLLTCRTHYFQTRGQADSVLAGKLVEEARSEGGFRMVELAPLGPKQIESIIRQRAADPEKALELIHKTYDLERLARRPVLLDLILTTVPKLAAVEGKLNAAKLYAVYTSEWITTDAWRSRLTPAQKERLMEALAVRMYVDEKLTVHYTDLRTFIREELGEQVATLTDLDYFDYDVRTCSFVNRDDGGNYRFMHKSFQEYFLAGHFAREFAQGGDTTVFNARPLPHEVGLFLADIDEISDERLLAETAVKDDDKKRFGGGNAATVLTLRGRLRKVTGGDLSHRDLRAANLTDQDLSGFQFNNTILDGAQLLKSRLNFATFRNASLKGTLFGGGEFIRISLGANGKFVTGLGTEAVTVWNIADGSPFMHFEAREHQKILDAEIHATLPILAILVSSGENEVAVDVHDLLTGKKRRTVCEGLGKFRYIALHPTRTEAIISGPRIARLPIKAEGATPILLDHNSFFLGRRAIITEFGIGWMGESGHVLWFNDGANVGTIVEVGAIAYDDSSLAATPNGNIWFASPNEPLLHWWTRNPTVPPKSMTLPAQNGGYGCYWLYSGPGESLLVYGNPRSLEIIEVTTDHHKVIKQQRKHVDWLAISADRRFAAVADGQQIHLLTVPDLKKVKTIRHHLQVEGADFVGARGLDAQTVALLRESRAAVEADSPVDAAKKDRAPTQPKRQPKRTSRRPSKKPPPSSA